MIEKTHSVAQRTRALITPIAMRILLLVIILGSIAVYLLPECALGTAKPLVVWRLACA